MSSPKSVFLVDPVYISAQGLISTIESCPGIKVKQHLTHLEKDGNLESADIYLFNLYSTTPDQLDLIDQHNLSGKTIVLTNPDFPTDILLAWEAGIASILSKNCSQADLESAFSKISNGERYYCQHTLDTISKSSGSSAPSHLSKRETEVIKHLALGKTTPQIADSLHISTHTVNSHRKNIMKKLQFKSPVELVVYAVKNEIIY